MATDGLTETDSEVTSSHVSTPQAVGGSDGSSSIVTVHKLNGDNFFQWSQSFLMFIYGRGKDDYLTGAAAAPKEDDQKYRTWKSENSMVMSWLINSMNPDIGEDFMYYNTAQEIWEAAKITYSDKENTSVVFEIKGKLHDLRQGDLSVQQYFNTLTRYWQQLDILESTEWDCPGDNVRYRKIVEKERIYKFLLGMNANLDEVRGRIMGRLPLASLREMFTEVPREALERKL